MYFNLFFIYLFLVCILFLWPRKATFWLSASADYVKRESYCKKINTVLSLLFSYYVYQHYHLDYHEKKELRKLIECYQVNVI